MGPHLALEVGVDVVLERHVLEVAQVRVGFVGESHTLTPALSQWEREGSPVRYTPGGRGESYRLGLGVLLRKDTAEQLLLGRLPA